MSTVGIIAEFNPFHNGHEYALAKAKEITGADTVIVAMSGDFVQRGCPAICNKYTRAKMALSANADIILELPTCFAISSAQGFAEGGVALLSQTNIVDYICFGSESGDIDEILSVADIIEKLDSDANFQKMIHDQIQTGSSYPAARAKVLTETAGIDASFLASPNNILALEYCLALKRLEKRGIKVPKPVTFKRMGDGYNTYELVDEHLVSATAIRELIKDTYKPLNIKSQNLQMVQLKNSLKDYVPANSLKPLTDTLGTALPVLTDDFSNALFIKLNTTPISALKEVPDINSDLFNSIIKNTREPFIISELIDKIKTKAFTYSAISRSLFAMLLHNEKIADTPEYIRILGFKKSKSTVLKSMRDTSELPIITKLADASLDSAMLRQDIFAANLYEQIVLTKFDKGFTDEYRNGVIIFEK